MKQYLSAGICLIIASCSNTPKFELPAKIGLISSAANLSCRFDKHFTGDSLNGKNSTAWYFWRNANKIEMRDEQSNQGEIWEKHLNGKLSYTRLFFNEGIALDFTPGDLAALDLNPAWEELNFIIPEEELGKSLKLISNEQTSNTPVEHYQGNIKGMAAEVDWLPTLKLPLRVLKHQKADNFSLVLAQCEDSNFMALKPSSPKSANSLRHIDFTDLGDMEDDPAVKKLEQLIGTHHE
jgi:hypothetical protein